MVNYRNSEKPDRTIKNATSCQQPCETTQLYVHILMYIYMYTAHRKTQRKRETEIDTERNNYLLVL